MQQDGQFETELLRWYRKCRRHLPWREDPAPYHVWLSEIMLQQTRVEAVKGYYARFLAALPDIPALAAAAEDRYLKLWEGLGYYSRVRNLHKAAVEIMEQHGGQMPSDSRSLAKLPGIGPYTAAAIASIAFSERVPAVDGNLLRVYARLETYPADIRTPEAKKLAGDYFLLRMSGEAPGDFNQALMDLGAAVCLPNAVPSCGACPLSGFCKAFRTGNAPDYPVRTEKKPRPVELHTVFLIHDAEKIALRKRPPHGLLAGLYEYPNVPGSLTEAEALASLKSLGFAPLRIRRLPDAKHIFTHKEWQMRGYEVLADELKPLQSDSVFLADLQALHEKYPIPSAFAYFTGQLS